MNESKQRIITRIGELTILLGGEMKQMTRVNSTGRSSKVIEIEYEINAGNY
jgi:ABC-type tungstate transport system substrate-binding protein